MGFRFDAQARKAKKGAPRRASGLGMVIVFIVLAISIVLGWRIPLIVPFRAYLPAIPESWYYPIAPSLNVLPIQLVVGAVVFILLQFIVVLFSGILFPLEPEDRYDKDGHYIGKNRP